MARSTGCMGLTGLICFAAALPLLSQVPELEQRFPWFSKGARPPEYPEIVVGADWLAKRLDSGEIFPIDLRPPSSYRAGHLPGAVNLRFPADPADAASVRRLIEGAGYRTPRIPVLLGGEEDRPAVGQAYLALAGAGWKDVKVLAAGDGSSTLALPAAVEPSPSEVRAAALPADGAARVFVTSAELRESFGRPGFEILDLRDPGGWGSGFEAPPRFAGGHIPHSLPFDVLSLLPSAGWPDPTKARAALAALGPRSSERVDMEATFLLYGDGPADSRLGLGYLLLRLLGVSARVFPGGFAAWAADPRDPVVRVLGAGELAAMLEREQKTGAAAGKPLRDRPPESFAIFDLREDWDYDDGHIPGAVSLPERLFAERFAAVLRERWPAAEPSSFPLVFYCYGRDCIRSRNCATLAAQKGFRNLLWLREGMSGWEESGRAGAR